MPCCSQWHSNMSQASTDCNIVSAEATLSQNTRDLIYDFITSQLGTVFPKFTIAVTWGPSEDDSHSVLNICYLSDIELWCHHRNCVG